MDKKKLIADMRSLFGDSTGFMTRRDLANYLNVKDIHNVDRFIKGLEAVDGKYYFIQDVASVLIDRATTK